MLNSILSILYAVLMFFTSMFNGISVKDNSIDFTGHEFPFSYEHGDYNDHTTGAPIIIETKEELDELISDFERYEDYYVALNEVFKFHEGITDDYFEENILITYVVVAPMGGMDFDVAEVISGETGTTVKYNYSGGITDAISTVLLVAEVKKSALVNIETIHFEGNKVDS